MDAKRTAFESNPDLARLKDDGKQMLERYARPENFDKLAQAQNNVDTLKVDMQQNVNKLLAKQDDLNTLEEQTHELRGNAEAFDKNAKDLEREMFWRKIKYAAIIAAIIIAIILIIVLSVVLSRKK